MVSTLILTQVNIPSTSSEQVLSIEYLKAVYCLDDGQILCSICSFYLFTKKLGELYTNKTVELRQDQQVITLVVTARDGGSPKLSAVVAINLQVIPVNHYAPEFPPQQTM